VSTPTPQESDALAAHQQSLGYRAAKRTFDVVLSAAVIVIAAVPSVVLGVAIAADTKAFPIFTQERVGKGGKPFKLFKFRTMVKDAENLDAYLTPEQREQWELEHKVDDDPRVTPLGVFLRRTSLDEVPNFLNVFTGDMSTVGPRAITQEELENFGDQVGKLLSVRPGVTGWWQVEARNDATFESGERQALELYYVDHASISLDLRIMFRTAGVMFGSNKTGR
jgi:lipopolysaccharide/colanic/teichoic acid biosynthesis glycosyltransferase